MFNYVSDPTKQKHDDRIPTILLWQRPFGKPGYGPRPDVHCGCKYTYDRHQAFVSDAVVIYCPDADKNNLAPDFPNRYGHRVGIQHTHRLPVDYILRTFLKPVDKILWRHKSILSRTFLKNVKCSNRNSSVLSKSLVGSTVRVTAIHLCHINLIAFPPREWLRQFFR